MNDECLTEYANHDVYAPVLTAFRIHVIPLNLNLDFIFLIKISDWIWEWLLTQIYNEVVIIFCNLIENFLCWIFSGVQSFCNVFTFWNLFEIMYQFSIFSWIFKTKLWINSFSHLIKIIFDVILLYIISFNSFIKVNFVIERYHIYLTII